MHDTIQVHLNLRGMSGRGVRLRVLPYTAIQAAQNEAAKLVGPGAAFTEFRNAYHSAVLTHFVAAVTPPGQEKLTEKTPWRDVTVADLTSPTSEFCLERMFRAREIAILEQLFRAEHEITEDELALITGKASPAATTG